MSGLSPRVRGNPVHPVRLGLEIGSIPARAGEPSTHGRHRTIPRVYPRACGGTVRTSEPPFRKTGLSPRVRGNPGLAPAACRHQGSIPARAGEPVEALRTSLHTGVYPRACGGTVREIRVSQADQGLSPRVRGNQVPEAVLASGRGSIPARAGEPLIHATVSENVGVYPRACGGTFSDRRFCKFPAGLSPRVRGNQRQGVHVAQCLGSIPARAGEPDSR